MVIEKFGRVIKGLGGLFATRVEENGAISLYYSRAKGSLKGENNDKLLVGDSVALLIDDELPDSVVISKILPRKNSLIRPPMANLDYLFIVIAAMRPMPQLSVIDKLTAIASHNGIIPILIITKSDLSVGEAERYAEIYRASGFSVFVTSSEGNEGIGALSECIEALVRDGKTAAFAGASGVGKSTLMNALFPELSLCVGEVSRKIERGRHTTRHVELFPLPTGGFIADTPGFSLIDFERFDFFSLDDLLSTFPDILPHAVGCRYQDCSHVGEGECDCAVARAAAEGKICPSRLASYREIYKTLKEKKKF